MSCDYHVISSSTQRGKLSSKYRGYFEDDELKNKLLHQLPRKLRKSIIYARYSNYMYVYSVVLLILYYMLYMPTFSNRTKLLINRRKSILRVFLNNTHHTGNTYVITPNVFSMEALALINRINSLFAIYVALIERKGDLKFFFSIFDPFYLRKYS